jgi:hypothetical protein
MKTTMGKCQKAIGKVGSRLRRCGLRAVARVHAVKQQRWVPVCAPHAREFRLTFPFLSERIRFD